MKARTIDELRVAAQRRLPRPVFDTIEGGAGDEFALTRNRQALDRETIVPRVLVDVDEIGIATTILGRPAASPIIVAPTGMNGYYWPRGELCVASAAAGAGVVHGVSAVGSVRLEEISAIAPARRWFQLYPLKDRAVSRDLVRRAKLAGYEALCVTVDAPVVALRKRDVRNQVQLPPRLSASLLLAAATRPRWAMPFAFGYQPTFANLAEYAVARTTDARGISIPELDRAFDWRALETLARDWDGPFIVKGVMHPDDVVRAASAGASGVVVSNHGGRQFDAAPSTLDALKLVRAEMPAGMEVFVDGGVMSGLDVLKFLQAGARACLVGRAIVYGLAAGGEAGAAAALRILADELKLAMALAGIADVGAIGTNA